MKRITLQIPESKFIFFMELIKSLGFVKVGESINEADFFIPEEHKAIVRERMKKSKENPERLLDWEDVKDKFRLD